MVRIIVGSLVKVGCGFWKPEQIKEALEARDRSKAGPKAPAEGLTLISIEEEELPAVIREENEHWSYRINQGEIEVLAKHIYKSMIVMTAILKGFCCVLSNRHPETEQSRSM